MVEEWVFVSEDGHFRRGEKTAEPVLPEPVPVPDDGTPGPHRYEMREYRPFLLRAPSRLTDEQVERLCLLENPWRAP